MEFTSEDLQELLYMELVSSVVCLVCNIYFAFRFNAVNMFNVNLRIIMVVFQIFTATIAFLHPVLRFVPESWYSIEEKQYLGAIVYYTIQYYVHVCLFIMSSKFAVFGIEQRLAVTYRANYEFQDGTKVKRLLTSFVIFLGTILLIKSVLVFCFDDTPDLQKRLERALMIEKFPPALIAIHIYATISWAYGLCEFVRLYAHIRKNWFCGKTLSESFQIKQSGSVLKVLQPIAAFFFVMLAINTVCMSKALYLYYYQDCPADHPRYVALMNVEYTCTAMYNLLATFYMLWYFKPVRRLMFKDLGRFFGFKARSKPVATTMITCQQMTEEHFAYLNASWNHLTGKGVMPGSKLY
ncbi:hypothetical protein M3Y97_00754100 [Aphelenchoides bicaudatus]|nr:hypothetical protein M3Y97_00754100 [Aphelenchoides bicaudatus]